MDEKTEVEVGVEVRTRLLKPEFFHDPDLTAVSPLARWFYLGLRTVADRDGRLLDEARRLGIQLLPVDGMDKAEALLMELASGNLVLRSGGVLQILKWDESCHPKEPASRIAPIENKGLSEDCTRQDAASRDITRLAGKRRERSVARAGFDSASASDFAFAFDSALKATSKTESTPLAESPIKLAPSAGEEWFGKFWKNYPKKKHKDAARKAHEKARKREKLTHEQFWQLLKAALNWQLNCRQWLKDDGQFVPDPATYLNGGGWKDEPGEGDQ